MYYPHNFLPKKYTVAVARGEMSTQPPGECYSLGKLSFELSGVTHGGKEQSCLPTEPDHSLSQ